MLQYQKKIDIFNNYIRAITAVIKYLSYLIGNKVMSNIWYKLLDLEVNVPNFKI